MDPAKAEAHVRATVNGVELHYETTGTGMPVFVVGLLECELYQRMLPDSMSQQFQLVFVELRGSGRSGGDPTSLSPATVAADLDGLRAELGLAQIAVFGHGIHGMFAAHYGRLYPRTVSHVLIASTPAMVPDPTVQEFWQTDSSPERQAEFARQLWSLPAELFNQIYASSEAFIRYRATVTADTWYEPTFDAGWLWEGITAPPALTNHVYGTLAPAWNAADVLRQVEAPTFVALRRWDYRVPYSSWLDHVGDVPDVTIHVFDRSSHWVPVEQPSEFVRAVATFLGVDRPTPCLAH